jgi:hypothetical protein
MPGISSGERHGERQEQVRCGHERLLGIDHETNAKLTRQLCKFRRQSDTLLDLEVEMG